MRLTFAGPGWYLDKLIALILLPLLPAGIVWLFGGFAFWTDFLFFCTCEIIRNLYVTYTPATIGGAFVRAIKEFTGVVLAPLPALAVLLVLFPEEHADALVNAWVMYAVYLPYGFLMVFALPAIQGMVFGSDKKTP